MSCMCGSDDCPRCYPDIYYQQRRDYDDETVDDRTNRILDEWEGEDAIPD